MDRIYIERRSLAKLRRLVRRGVFAVPELQREFVWSAKKACLLLDSIFANYPIGTVLVWKTNRRNEGQLRKKLHILPPFDHANREIYFLIDGQQRLSVLWNVIRGEATRVRNADGREIDFGRMYFDARADDGEPAFIYRQRQPTGGASRLVPVVDILGPNWRRVASRLGKRAAARVTECRRRLLRYEIHLVFCESNSIDEVRESFIRINSAGTRITTADRAFARASKFNMRGLVKEVQSQLKNGFDQVSSQTILQTMVLASGQRDLGERAIESFISKLERRGEFDRFNRQWRQLSKALLYAADYFSSDLSVPNMGFLPSEPMMTILGLYFFHNGCRRPPQGAKRRLRQWFWATAVGARYTGRGYAPNILGDAEFVKRLAQSPRAKASFKVRVPRYVLRSTQYGRPGPVSNGFFCLLRAQKPRYLEDGAEIPLNEISSRGNRSDKHHIFPRGLLGRHRIGPDRFNCLLNICYLVARENQSVGQKAPRHYLKEVPHNGRARMHALRSHLIPSDAEAGIWDSSVKRGFKTFMEERTNKLIRAFEEQAEMRLFDRD